MKNFFKICMVLLALSGKMYSQNWLWSKSQNINSFSPFGSNVRSSSSGNLVSYLWDPSGSHLVFTNADGDVVWNKYFQNLQIRDVVIDGTNNIYFAGCFTGATAVPPGSFVTNGGSDAIIGVLNSNGVLIKSKVFGTSADEWVNSIALNGGNIFVAGVFLKQQTINSVTLTGDNTHFNTFVLKFDPALNAIAGAETKSETCYPIKIAVDKTNSVYLLGESDYILSIGTHSIFIAENGTYMAKFNSNLEISWLQTINSHYMNGTYKPFIYFDASNNFILGRRSGGGGGSSHNILIEKYGPSGALIWQKNTNVNAGCFLDVDEMDNVWIAGGYGHFDGSYTFLIEKITSAGSYYQVISDTSIAHRVYGLAVKANNDLYIIGNCDGGSALNGYGCSPEGSIFMAHYGPLPTSIEKVTLNKSVSIYPNPATGMITISCDSGIKSGCTLIIKNALGQLVYLDPIKETSGSFIKEVDLGFQPKGAYLVEVESNYERTSKTVILH